DLARRHGVHQTASIIVRTDDAGAVMSRLRDNPPTQLAGLDVTVAGRADVLIFTGDGVRLAVRPSGTEPKVKGYIEIRVPTDNDLAAARRSAQSLCEEVRREAGTVLGSRDRLNR
ncbi:MAG TPA: phospho-sugar mutase, partial [Mycobacterium sp.]|nr:phospho-sugar mutase [Mycobacterium sp.]